MPYVTSRYVSRRPAYGSGRAYGRRSAYPARRQFGVARRSFGRY